MRYILSICLVFFIMSVCVDGASVAEKPGLVAHYYKDHKNWKGNWPDTESKPDVSPDGWTFTEYKYSRTEPLVNHLFSKRGWFSVRWKGYIDTAPGDRRESDKPGDSDEIHEYKFEVFADDGCRVFIDGKPIISDWRARWEKSPEATRTSSVVKLKDGKHRIVIEYFQGQSLKSSDKDPMKLYWSSPSRGIPMQIIPASHFSHAEEDRKNISR